MSALDHEREDPGLAAEYALGVLDAGERTAVQRRLESDSALAAEVRGWEDRLHPLAREVAATAPSEALWSRVSASIAAAEPRAAARPEHAAGLWRSLGFWRAATAGFAAIAACAVVVAVTRTPEPQTTPPMMIARVGTDAGAPVLVVAYDPMRRTAVVTPLAPAAPAGHSHELWLIDAQGTPHSLGVIRMDGATPHAVPEAMVPMAGENTVIAVTVEPAGGSPTGAPSGPPVASGALHRV